MRRGSGSRDRTTEPGLIRQPVFWGFLAAIFVVAASRNLLTAVLVADLDVRVERGIVSATLLLGAILSVGRALSLSPDRDTGSPGRIAEGRATRQGIVVAGVVAVAILVVVVGLARIVD